MNHFLGVSAVNIAAAANAANVVVLVIVIVRLARLLNLIHVKILYLSQGELHWILLSLLLLLLSTFVITITIIIAIIIVVQGAILLSIMGLRYCYWWWRPPCYFCCCGGRSHFHVPCSAMFASHHCVLIVTNVAVIVSLLFTPILIVSIAVVHFLLSPIGFPVFRCSAPCGLGPMTIAD